MYGANWVRFGLLSIAVMTGAVLYGGGGRVAQPKVGGEFLDFEAPIPVFPEWEGIRIKLYPAKSRKAIFMEPVGVLEGRDGKPLVRRTGKTVTVRFHLFPTEARIVVAKELSDRYKDAAHKDDYKGSLPIKPNAIIGVPLVSLRLSLVSNTVAGQFIEEASWTPPGEGARLDPEDTQQVQWVFATEDAAKKAQETIEQKEAMFVIRYAIEGARADKHELVVKVEQIDKGYWKSLSHPGSEPDAKNQFYSMDAVARVASTALTKIHIAEVERGRAPKLIPREKIEVQIADFLKMVAARSTSTELRDGKFVDDGLNGDIFLDAKAYKAGEVKKKYMTKGKETLEDFKRELVREVAKHTEKAAQVDAFIKTVNRHKSRLRDLTTNVGGNVSASYSIGPLSLGGGGSGGRTEARKDEEVDKILEEQRREGNKIDERQFERWVETELRRCFNTSLESLIEIDEVAFVPKRLRITRLADVNKHSAYELVRHSTKEWAGTRAVLQTRSVERVAISVGELAVLRKEVERLQSALANAGVKIRDLDEKHGKEHRRIHAILARYEADQKAVKADNDMFSKHFERNEGVLLKLSQVFKYKGVVRRHGYDAHTFDLSNDLKPGNVRWGANFLHVHDVNVEGDVYIRDADGKPTKTLRSTK